MCARYAIVRNFKATLKERTLSILWIIMGDTVKHAQMGSEDLHHCEKDSNLVFLLWSSYTEYNVLSLLLCVRFISVICKVYQIGKVIVYEMDPGKYILDHNYAALTRTIFLTSFQHFLSTLVEYSNCDIAYEC